MISVIHRRISVDGFSSWLTSVPGGTLAPGSAIAYEREAQSFLAFVGGRRKRVQRRWVENWLGSRQVSPSTATRALSAISKLSEYRRLPDPTKGIRRPRRDKALPRPVQGLPFVLKSMQDAGEHDLAFVAVFLASTGLRVSEACGENGCGFELVEDGEAIRVHGKGRKDRIVPLDESAKTALAMLTPPTGFTRLPYTVKRLQGALRPYGVTPHQFRHFAATEWYERTGDLFLVSKLLGHSSVATSQIYAAMSSKRLRAAMGGGR